MCFEKINTSIERGEFYGAMCRWHRRKDGQITIYEIAIEPSEQGSGLAFNMLNRLKQIENVTSIFAKCPTDLMANDWYKRQGFVLEIIETLETGRQVNHWRLTL